VTYGWLLALACAAGVLGVAARVHRFGRRAERLPEAPCLAVVLGARVLEDGTPSDALRGRVEVGVELLARGRASALLFSGGSPDARPAEAVVARALALAAGAPGERLLIEPDSTSTFDNARRVAPLLSARDAREIVLITCDFHLLRATAHFRAQGLTVHPVASRRTLSASDRLLVTARESVALLRRPWLLAGGSVRWPR
jgi:uncharacterized SAM-binding protein YcdF (DUF218 family)